MVLRTPDSISTARKPGPEFMPCVRVSATSLHSGSARNGRLAAYLLAGASSLMVLAMPLRPAFSQEREPVAAVEQASAEMLPEAPGRMRTARLAEAPAVSFSSSASHAEPFQGPSAGSDIEPQSSAATAGSQPPPAERYDKYILPGQAVPKLSVSDKFVLGVRDTVTPFAASGWIGAAAYEQITNGSPNFGQTGKGFAQRLGTAAARAASEGIFSDSVLAPILREDPRYYKLGKGRSIIARLVYAGTRTLITRTDGGRKTVNLALLGGNAAGSALTNLYYPDLNQGFVETAKTFGGSVGGSAVGFVVSEFLSDTLEAIHLK